MAGYGSLHESNGTKPETEKNGDASPPVPAKPKLPAVPIFLQNPDETITEAIPSNYRYPKKLRRTCDGAPGQNDEDSDVSNGHVSEWAFANMHREVDYLYSRHERILLLLLTVQILLQGLYAVVYILRMRDGSSIVEFMAMYSWHINPRMAESLFWTIFGIQVVYTFVYYVFAGLAVWNKRPKRYRIFANYSIAGIAGLVLLAYVDKFNLIIFFLHLLVYVYARFLQGLTASLVLLPSTQAAA